ncbi:AI-2E family transporter [Halosimplex halophilum]|uniref:AI-2E family transporter n=1 Tax=Halosimplex halophilum TaxID=2559572 RepID=UPI00107F0725|nr:AI-2E family transporter [Halosimplex halophilum]
MVEFEFDPDWGRIGWAAVGIVLGLALLWVLYSFVGTFVFALFIYYSTRRVHGEIRDRVGQRSVSAALALVTLALPAVLLLLYATAIGVQELQEFAGTTDLGEYIAVADPYLNVTQAVENPRGVFEGAGGMDLVGPLLSRGTSYLGFLGTGLLHLFVIFAVAFYLLRDDHRLAAWVADFDDDGPTVFEEFAREVDDSLELIFAGNILNAVVTATVGAITYSVLNVFAPPEVAVPYAALVGLLTGIASLIPVVGMKLVYVPVSIYLAATAFTEGTGWVFVGAFVAVSFVVVDVIPDLMVRPYVTGGSLHTGSVMFAYILGPLLFGWYGLFLGPMILVFLTHFGGVVVPALLGRDRPDEGDGAAADGSATEDESGDGVTRDADAAAGGSPPTDDEATTPGGEAAGSDDGPDASGDTSRGDP